MRDNFFDAAPVFNRAVTLREFARQGNGAASETLREYPQHCAMLLFRSRDGGDSWEMVEGISNHDHARKWHPGNGGLCMHTIVRDGSRMHLGISTGGHYLSEDGGATFTAANPADAQPPPDLERVPDAEPTLGHDTSTNELIRRVRAARRR